MENESVMNQLPIEDLAKILSFLSPLDVGNVACVSTLLAPRDAPPSAINNVRALFLLASYLCRFCLLLFPGTAALLSPSLPFA